MSANEFSLENLTPVEFSPEKFRAAIDHVQTRKQAYIDAYGADEGKRLFYEACKKKNMTLIRKNLNERIYRTGKARDFFNPSPSETDQQRFETRLREVYGDQYDELVANRVMYDPRVATLLVNEALMTGVWDELPTDLQDVYWTCIRDRKDKL